MTEECPCGLTYARFRTGFTYADVYAMLWVESDDSALWRHKRRNTILGVWRELKQDMFRAHVQECEYYQRANPQEFAQWANENSTNG